MNSIESMYLNYSGLLEEFSEDVIRSRYAFLYKECMEFLKSLGLKKDKLRFRDHSQDELSFYSVATTDIEYEFPFGFGELWGIADRTDYDLGVHMEHSKEDLRYLDPETNEKYIPYVVESTVGLDRTVLAVLCEAYDEETLEDGSTREIMRLKPYLAPYKVAVLPLVKKFHKEKAEEIYREIQYKLDRRMTSNPKFRELFLKEVNYIYYKTNNKTRNNYGY